MQTCSENRGMLWQFIGCRFPLGSYSMYHLVSVTQHPFGFTYLTYLASKLLSSVNLCRGLLHTTCHPSPLWLSDNLSYSRIRCNHALTSDVVEWSDLFLWRHWVNKKTVLSQRWLHHIYGCPENFRDSLTAPMAVFPTFFMGFCSHRTYQ